MVQVFRSRFHRFIPGVLLLVGLLSASTSADPTLNSQRAPNEPGWQGQIFLQGEAKATKDATPILERSYRPLHVYGNMQRRHFYRDTVVPSQLDRTDRRQAFFSGR
jgi:hypothetical protein